jgi:hypothetical protein
MSLRGETFRRLATWLCSARTIDRLIDPAVGDFRIEVAEARLQGNGWHYRRVLVAGYLGLMKVSACAVGADIIAPLGPWTVEERSALVRATLIFVPTAILATLALELLYYRAFLAGSVSNYALLMTLLVPGMVPISVPAAYAFGLAYAVPGSLWSRRLAALALGVATLCGAALLANMAWVAPESNQRFRETVLQRPVERGENELSLKGLRQRRAEYRRIEPAGAEARRADFLYQQRWTTAAAAVLLAVFAMAVGVCSRRPRWQLGLAVLAAGAVYEELHGAGLLAVQASVLSPVAAAWLPNAVLLASSALIFAGRRLKPVR